MTHCRTSYMPKYVPRTGDGCVLWYPGQTDPHSAVIKDHSGCGNHGAISGAIWEQTDKGMWVLSYDGIDDLVNCGNNTSLDITSTLTIEVWIKPALAASQLDDWPAIIGKSSHYWIYITKSNGKGCFRMQASDGSWHNAVSNDAIPTEWTHMVGVHSGTQQKLYINGILQSSMGSWTGTLKSDINLGVYIGEVATRNIIALINGVRIYNRALGIEEIKSHYRQERHLCEV